MTKSKSKLVKKLVRDRDKLVKVALNTQSRLNAVKAELVNLKKITKEVVGQ